VPLDALPDDSYRYDRASHSLSGRRPGHSFRLGDRVRVAVARVDLERRELDFRLLGFGRPGRVAPPRTRSPSRPARPEKRSTKKPPKKAHKKRRPGKRP
jgi:ribonuclease R